MQNVRHQFNRFIKKRWFEISIFFIVLGAAIERVMMLTQHVPQLSVVQIEHMTWFIWTSTLCMFGFIFAGHVLPLYTLLVICKRRTQMPFFGYLKTSQVHIKIIDHHQPMFKLMTRCYALRI